MIRVVLVLLALASLPAAALDLQAHRGGRGLMPENTLPAFARALSLGVSTLELDTAVTKDGVVVISHDPALNPNLTRGPDGAWLEAVGPAIVTLSFQELQRYDVGRLKPQSRYAANYPDQKAVDGTRIPRLSDLFQLVGEARNNTVHFNIEIKTSPLKPDETLAPEQHADKLIEVIRAAGMAGRSTIQSFDWRGLRQVQQAAPEIPTVCLTAQQSWLDNVSDGRWTAGKKLVEHGGSVPRLVRAAGCRIWSPYFGDATAELVREARLQNLKVVVWTVNEVADMERTLAWPVDGIITDRPDRLREVLIKHGLATPTPTPITP